MDSQHTEAAAQSFPEVIEIDDDDDDVEEEDNNVVDQVIAQCALCLHAWLE